MDSSSAKCASSRSARKRTNRVRAASAWSGWARASSRDDERAVMIARERGQCRRALHERMITDGRTTAAPSPNDTYRRRVARAEQRGGAGNTLALAVTPPAAGKPPAEEPSGASSSTRHRDAGRERTSPQGRNRPSFRRQRDGETPRGEKVKAVTRTAPGRTVEIGRTQQCRVALADHYFGQCNGLRRQRDGWLAAELCREMLDLANCVVVSGAIHGVDGGSVGGGERLAFWAG